MGTTFAGDTLESGHELERFIPRYAVALGGDFDSRWATVDGTLCHIDISGFTNLSERLANLGRVGAEELTEFLDRVFGAMVALAQERGGSLLKFGGDALLLLFEGDDHAIQAASAAVEMRSTLRTASEIPTSVGRLSLRMSVGLHSADVYLFRARGNHTELIVAGDAASMVTEMEETASAGEIVVSESTRALLPAGSATEATGNGWILKWRATRTDPAGVRPRMMGDHVSAHIPTALRRHLTKRKADAEHRLATVAFVEFVGVDDILSEIGPDGAARAIETLIADVTAVADEEQITFLGTDVDRGAGKIILVSGVPVTLVDESGRVLRAVRRIADIDTPFGIKIGVNRGHVFSGEIGTDTRSTYTVMGDTVNLAARLMGAAPQGSIYATAAALEESLTLFDTRILDPINVKGKAEPVAALEVLDESGSRTPPGAGILAFEGRDSELAVIADAIATLASGRGGTIKVSGPRGIGKSRIIEEALAHPVTDSLFVRAEPYGTANPYRPFRDPIRSLLNVSRGSHEQMGMSLVKALTLEAPELLPFAPLVGDLAHVELPQTDATAAIDPRYRQSRIADIAVELFERFHDGELIVVAEDIHWADAASVALVERLARESERRPWLVITTNRDVPEPATDSDVVLAPLEPAIVESLVFSATEASPLRPDVVSAIVERAGGNPLFVQELVKAVRETGDIASLPTSLDGVIGSQIDALEPLARRVLRYVSVLGRSFRTSVARELIATQDIELNAPTRATLTEFLDDDGPERLQFRHALVRDVAYEGLSFRRRRELHLAAGELVLGRAEGDEAAFADVLALHFYLGGDHERAWRYCTTAGNKNMELFANTEAGTQFERAAEVGKPLDSVTSEDLRDVLIRLGDVRERSGQFDASLEAYRNAAKLTRGDAVGRAEVLLKRARAKERAGEYSAALAETTRARTALAGESSEPGQRVLAKVLSLASMIRQAQERPRLALRAAEDAVAAASNVGEQLALARAWQVMDYAHLTLGQSDKVIYSQKALDVYRSLGELEEEASVLTNLGAFAFFDDDWATALELYEKSEEAFGRVGNLVGAATAQANIGEVYVNQGRYEVAEEPLRAAKRIATASGFSETVAFVDLLLGRMFGISGDLSAAKTSLQEAIDEASALGQGGFVFEASIHLADAQCRAGSAETGLSTLSDAERNVSGDYFDFHRPLFCRVKGSVLESAGEFDRSVELLEEGIALAEERGDAYELALLVLTLDRIAHDVVGSRRRDEARGTLRALGVQSVPGITVAV